MEDENAVHFQRTGVVLVSTLGTGIYVWKAVQVIAAVAAVDGSSDDTILVHIIGDALQLVTAKGHATPLRG